MQVELGGCHSCGAVVERRLVVLQELGLERPVQAKLPVQQVPQGSAKLLVGPFWAVRAEQQEVR
jgi:hypothetical protein